MTTALRLTEDWSKLTPDQEQQAEAIAKYSKAASVRYVAIVTKDMPAQATSQASSCSTPAPIVDPYLAKYRSERLRDRVIFQVFDPVRFLNLIKRPLTPYLWEGREFFTTKQIADYYGVSESFVHNHLISIRKELEADGFEGLRGKAANRAKQVICKGETASKLLIWSPRAAIRLGLVIPGSNVATWLRNAIEVGGHSMNEHGYREWIKRYIDVRSLPPQDVPVIAAALKGLAAELEQRVEAGK